MRWSQALIVSLVAVAVLCVCQCGATDTLVGAAAPAPPQLVAQLAVDSSLANRPSVTFVLRNPSLTVPVWVSRVRTPLEGVHADMFDIISVDQSATAQRMPYKGIIAKRGEDGETDFVLLKPGQEIVRTAFIGNVYELVTGNYRVTCRVQVTVAVAGVSDVIDADGVPHMSTTASRSSQAIRTNTVDLKVSGFVYRAAYLDEENRNRTKSSHSNGLLGSIYYDDCSTTRKPIVIAALDFAKAQVENVGAYLDRGCDANYVTYFGSYAAYPSRYDYVRVGYENILAKINSNNFEIDCTPSNCPSEKTYAYVYKYDGDYRIHLCNKFWIVSAQTGFDTQWGTIVHEFSHFYSIRDTSDHTYGEASCKALAISNPSNAIRNADNYEYFAESRPSLC